MDSQLINYPNREKPDENLNIMDMLDQKRQLLIQIKGVKSEIIELEKAYKQQIYKTESLLLQNSPSQKEDEYSYSNKVLLLENILKTENSQFKISKKSFTDDLKDALANEIIEYKQLIRSSSREYIKKRNEFLKVQNSIDQIHKNSNIEMVETQNIIIDDLKDELSLLKSKELKFQEELKSLVTDSITPDYDGVEYANLCEQYEKLKYYHTKKLLAKKDLEKRNKKELEKALERQREINREINERAERERFRTMMKSRISSSKMSRRESRAIEFLENQKKSKLQQKETISYELNQDEPIIDSESKILSDKILGHEIPSKKSEKPKEKSDTSIEKVEIPKNQPEKGEIQISSNELPEKIESIQPRTNEQEKLSQNESLNPTEEKVQEIILSKPEETQQVIVKEQTDVSSKPQNVIDDNEIKSFEIPEQRGSSIKVQEETDKQVTIVMPDEQIIDVVEENSEINTSIPEKEPETQEMDVSSNNEQIDNVNVQKEQPASQNERDEIILEDSAPINEKEDEEPKNMIDDTENIDLSLNIIDEKIDEADLDLKTRDIKEKIEQSQQTEDKQTENTTNLQIETETPKIENLPNEERSNDTVKEENNETTNIIDQKSIETKPEPEKISNENLDQQNQEDLAITNATDKDIVNQNDTEEKEKIEIISPSKLNLKIDGIISESDESVGTMLTIEPEKDIPEIIDQKSEQTANNDSSNASANSNESNKEHRVKFINLGGLGKPSKLRRTRSRPKVVYEISFTDDFVEAIDFK
ncbi:hypothetical protein TVAG_215250 [Trichomonas vaginalis G3]|uniref:Uncharacterized protein n=1 Tax=Trichomonas vaginalis (strain ATCC PRA-98 / G3) TaxID=412133 RepID=A2F655_TRIV3|nr:hypothetical protein TVAGG3_0363980 [Trichomonas vaginalis G3]EAX99625.1 hypothetical protein TVAG_215250 [Trichomonas vaginalis G3]KAI5532140.1 hypothetical protein TVAGG3_0363980 [Trichomonas vaginalis G3]|eukprot:XP_001312555.1 hypothetical protein [Trichomonas vaginalis G3]